MNKTRILVVEDEKVTAETIQATLLRLGYEIPAVLHTGEEAMGKAADIGPDLILMDVVLAGSVDGIRAADWIRTNLHIPVVYVTADSDEHTLERAKVTEPFGYLLKPVDSRLLHSTIEMALYKYRIDRQLRESEQRYKHLVASITNYIFTVTVEDGRPASTVHGPGCVAVTGYASEEYQKDPDLWYRMVHEDDRESVLRQSAMVLSGTAFTPLEHRIIHKNGSVRWIQNTPVPRYDEQGRLIAYDGLITDITERKKLEDQLRHAQKMEAVGQLAGGVAHDFNNILSAMIGYASLLQMHLGTDGPLRHNADQILALTERAATLTQGLLAFSRKQIINPRPIDINEIVRRVEKLLLRVIGEDIELNTALNAAPMTILADNGQMEQILMNLCTNARDAMPQGGTLIIRTDIVEIDDEFIKTHSYGKKGKYALLSVIDTGTGMDEKTRQKIFEPFFTTKEVGKGTGLGLSMVYGAVKQHDGYIVVSSEPGKGSTFNIYVPLLLSEAEKKDQMIVSPPDDIPRGTETVLVGEDDPLLRKLTREILEEFGYTVIDAVDGDDAMQKFRPNKDSISLVILDVVMPRMNGKEAYDAIRAVRPDIKALFMSGYTADVVHKKAIFDEGLNFVAKPVTPRDLLKKVREVLDSRTAGH